MVPLNVFVVVLNSAIKGGRAIGMDDQEELPWWAGIELATGCWVPKQERERERDRESSKSKQVLYNNIMLPYGMRYKLG